jgi:hypothetical protein
LQGSKSLEVGLIEGGIKGAVSEEEVVVVLEEGGKRLNFSPTQINKVRDTKYSLSHIQN